MTGEPGGVGGRPRHRRLRGRTVPGVLSLVVLGGGGRMTAAGEIRHSDGLPCSGCEITLDTKASDVVRRASTDPGGRFLLSDLPAGTYSVFVAGADGRQLVSTDPGSPFSRNSSSVEVREGVDVTGLSFIAPPPAPPDEDVVSSIVAGVPVPAGAPPRDQEGFWSFLKEGQLLRRCHEGAPSQASAEAAWRRIESAVDALADHSNAEAVLKSIRDLLRQPCLGLAVENGPLRLPSHPTAVRAWWRDGGKYWLWSYVRPGKSGSMDDLRETVSLPPDPRRVLFRETSTDPALAPLLCSESEPACGAETGGWVQRASEALAAPRERRRTWYDEPRKPDPWLACDGQGPDAYARWRACIGNIDERVKALPLGRTRAPREGWLVVAGRRGHYEFCDGVSAYDLATGAAYRAESCSGLALRQDGSVDVEATDASRESRVRSGRSSLDNVREAAWMLVMDAQSERLHTRGRDYPLPRGLEPRMRFHRVPGEPSYAISGMWNSGQTLLRWAWVRNDGTVQAEGSLIWGSDDLSEAHAGDLLDVVERGLVEGCAPAPLPDELPRRPSAVGSVDSSPSSVRRASEGLWVALAAHRAPACPAP